MRLRLLFLLAMLVSLCTFGLAQRTPAGGGNRTPTSIPTRPANRDVRVEIQLTDEHSRPLNEVMAMVEIGALGGGPQRTYVNPDGRATFSVRSGMTYQVTVSGADIENTSLSFELFSDEMVHHEMIAVKFKKDASKGAPGGMVSAANLKIPSKARDEFAKGNSDLNENKWENAKKHFEKAIKEYPQYDWAYNNLGVAEMQLKEPEAAEQAFAKAVELNDKNPDATCNLAQVKIGQKDLATAKELLKKTLISQPQNPKALTLLAVAQYRTQEFDAALANAEKAHQGDVDPYPLAHFLAARIREAKGDQAGAERQYQAYLKEAPEGEQAALAKEGLVRVQAKK